MKFVSPAASNKTSPVPPPSSSTAPLLPRTTLARPITLHGKGIHSGIPCEMTIRPAPAGTSYQFRRMDLDGTPIIPVTYDHLAQEELDRRTTLRTTEAAVHTIEHVLSALTGCGVHDATIEQNAPEPPFLDGSALPFANAIKTTGLTPSQGQSPLHPLIIPHPITFAIDGAEFSALPDPGFRVTFFFTSDHPALRAQSQTIAVTPDTYLADIAPARTFCFFEEIETLRQANLIKGANLNSALVIGRKSIINNTTRFDDEPVRHKILDFIGDMALIGRPLQGHFLVWRGGHRVNALFGKYLKKEFNL